MLKLVSIDNTNFIEIKAQLTDVDYPKHELSMPIANQIH